MLDRSAMETHQRDGGFKEVNASDDCLYQILGSQWGTKQDLKLTVKQGYWCSGEKHGA